MPVEPCASAPGRLRAGLDQALVVRPAMFADPARSWLGAILHLAHHPLQRHDLLRRLGDDGVTMRMAGLR